MRKRTRTKLLTPADLIIKAEIANRKRLSNSTLQARRFYRNPMKRKIIVCKNCGNVSINDTHKCNSKWNRYFKSLDLPKVDYFDKNS